MKRGIKSTGRKSLPLAVLIMTLLASTGALAQQSGSQTESWQFGVSIYGWFPEITGQTAFTQDGSNSEFEIDADDILDNLKFTLMGMINVSKGRWGILTDVIYMDVGDSETGTRKASIGRRQLPVDAAADVDLDIKSWVWTLAGYYRALDQSGLTLDVVAGARYLDVEQEVDWVVTGNVGPIPVPDRTGTAKESLTNWDALIGVRETMKDRAEIWKWRRDLLVTQARLAGATEEEAEASVPKVTLRVLDVSFDAISDPKERAYFMDLPTSFVLPAEAIDRLREIAGRLLRQSAEYETIVRELGGSPGD